MLQDYWCMSSIWLLLLLLLLLRQSRNPKRVAAAAMVCLSRPAGRED
jgi:hypothetical protein